MNENNTNQNQDNENKIVEILKLMAQYQNKS